MRRNWFELPLQPDMLVEAVEFCPDLEEKKKSVTLEQDGSQWEQNSGYRLKTHTCMSGGGGWGPAFQPAHKK